MRLWGKSSARTDPLRPENDPSRDSDDDLEEGTSRRKRGVKLPAAKKKFLDMPPQWRERQGIMTLWTYFSYSNFFLLPCCSCGACLGFVGGSLYTGNCCVPRKNPKGMVVAFYIYMLGLGHLILDLMTTVILVALGTFYTVAECSYAENICDLRGLIAIILYCSAGIVFLRSIVALNAFLAMWDYRREMQREQLLEEKLKAETEARFQEYAKRKQLRKTKK